MEKEKKLLENENLLERKKIYLRKYYKDHQLKALKSIWERTKR